MRQVSLKREMESLENFVLWSGRYPIDMKYDQLSSRGVIGLDYPNEHTVLVNAIYDKAVAELSKTSAAVNASALTR